MESASEDGGCEVAGEIIGECLSAAFDVSDHFAGDGLDHRAPIRNAGLAGLLKHRLSSSCGLPPDAREVLGHASHVLDGRSDLGTFPRVGADQLNGRSDGAGDFLDGVKRGFQ